jgi:formylmethanofuran dehydrogenase subunit D
MHCVFIAGRTIKQGQQENMGKLRDEYLAVVSTLDMNPQDLAQLELVPGMPVRVRSEWGEAVYTCAEGDLPRGMVFVPYGPPTCQLMSGDTDGTGMPSQKNWEVEVEPVTDQPLSGRSEA